MQYPPDNDPNRQQYPGNYPQYPHQPFTQPPQGYGYPPMQQPMPPQQQPKKPSNKRTGCIVASVFAALVVLVVIIASASNGGGGASASNTQSASSGTTSQPATTPVPTKALTWQTSHTYTGNGDSKTETFTIAGNDWKLEWSCDPSGAFDGEYNVIADVDNSDGTYADPAAINTICKSGNVSGETEEHQAGTFYLSIVSEDAWTMKIQELK